MRSSANLLLNVAAAFGGLSMAGLAGNRRTGVGPKSKGLRGSNAKQRRMATKRVNQARHRARVKAKARGR